MIKNIQVRSPMYGQPFCARLNMGEFSAVKILCRLYPYKRRRNIGLYVHRNHSGLLGTGLQEPLG